MKFAVIIKQLRKKNGYTQEELAKMLKVSKSTISMYEQGERIPAFETMEAIADIFNVDMDILYGRENKRDELNEYLEELRTRPEMRMLFSISKGATKEDIEKAVAIIEALRKTNG